MPAPTAKTDVQHALFGGLIDHAPTFPPAQLPLVEGLAEHRRVRGSKHGWIVNRFVCPASKLPELGDEPLRLSVVVDTGQLPAPDPRIEAVEAAGNILDLAASLPADYKKMRDRIEELVGELRNQIIEESLTKGATMAQVLEADKRLRQSPEGRTFRSFTAFLEDPQQQLRFRSAIGEVLGMVVGTALGWSALPTVVLSVVLAFVFGYSLTIRPVLRSGLALAAAVPVALAADTVSISVMEVMDNAVMLVVPGAMSTGLGSPLFWGSLALSLLVAFVVTVPVNRLLIARGKGHAVVHQYHHAGHGQHDDQADHPDHGTDATTEPEAAHTGHAHH